MLIKKLVITVTLLLLLVKCSGSGTKSVITRTDFLLDTVVTVTLYGSDNTAALDGAIDLCRLYDNMLDRYDEESEIYRLNHAGETPMAVSPQLRELLETAVYYHRLSESKYDITIAPVIDLWDFKAEEPALPDPAALNQALSLVDWRNIEISGDTVTLRRGAQIDLGSIAKGYIADKLGEYLRREGIESAIINLGGNILTVGEKPGGKPFEIGVQKPFEHRNEILGSVKVRDTSVVSSGVYERFFIFDQVLYHHIIDPSNGYPVDNGLLAVTILSQSSAYGDALSTISFLLGANKGMELIEQLDGVEAIFVTTDGSAITSSGCISAFGYEPAG